MTGQTFEPGQLVVTPLAAELFRDSGFGVQALLARHLSGDFGEIGDAEQIANEEAIDSRTGRVCSEFLLADEKRLATLTMPERSFLPVMLVSTDFLRDATVFCTPEDVEQILKEPK